jgi:hypothetical protein
MAINNTEKSSRFLQSRRYTHDSFTDAQEAFTSVLDINSNEVYTDQILIPTASLPFSGSSQSGSIYTANGVNVLKYYYRYSMTRSNLVSGSANEVWFLLSPTGSNSGIGAQIIDANQQTNFISPKYATPSLANSTAEDSPAGYLAKVFVSNNSVAPAGTDVVSVNNYSFDYKTGVLQFATNAVAPTTSQYVYITVYQYTGKTLNASLGSLTGSFTGSFFGIFTGTIPGFTSYQIATGSVTASVDVNPNSLFLIKSGSSIYYSVSASSQTTLYSDLFIIKGFTSQQPVLTVSQSIIQFATQSSIPTGTTQAGSIWFTSSSLYVGLEN